MCSMPVAASLVPSTGHLFSQLLAMEGAASVEKSSQPVDLSATHTISTHPSNMNHVETCAPDAQSSRLSRVEALKASAVSLSSRIEREARKLAGCGINYGMTTGTKLSVTPQDEDTHWIKPLSPPVRESPGGADETSVRIQRLLRAGQSAFGGDQAELPGVGNLYSLGSRERKENMTKPRPSPTGPTLPFTEHVEPLGSSGGSISEGPLTDSSLSEAEDHPGRH